MYVTPRRVQPGAKVALVAPASPFQGDEVVAGIDIIREMGLEVVLGPNVRNLRSSDIHSAPIMDRAEELMWAFTDPEVEGIITVLGGLGSGEVLPYLDFNAIRQSRKPLLGLSDITALNNGLLAGAGLISINGQYPSIRLDKGPNIRKLDEESLRLSLKMMMSDAPWADVPFQVNQYLPRTVSPGKARGHIIGGNLDTFCTLMGTPFMPDVDGGILFIEDVHKSGEAVARLLIHCKLAGVFDRIAGIVVGEFCDIPKKEDPKEPAMDDVVLHYLSDGVPCVYGYSFSHGGWTIPFPVGGDCSMDADTGEVCFNFQMA